MEWIFWLLLYCLRPDLFRCRIFLFQPFQVREYCWQIGVCDCPWEKTVLQKSIQRLSMRVQIFGLNQRRLNLLSPALGPSLPNNGMFGCISNSRVAKSNARNSVHSVANGIILQTGLQMSNALRILSLSHCAGWWSRGIRHVSLPQTSRR
jgi:hypothetical protein